MRVDAFRIAIVVMVLQTAALSWRVFSVSTPMKTESSGLVATADRVPLAAHLLQRDPTPEAVPAPHAPTTPRAAPSAVPAPQAPAPLELETALPLVPGEVPGNAGPLNTAVRDPAPSATDSEPWTEDRVVIRLRSAPMGARIWIDGRSRGRTPAKVMVPPGRHRIELELDGRRTVVRDAFRSHRELCFELVGRRLRAGRCNHGQRGGEPR